MRILYHHRTLGDGAEGIHVAAMIDAFRELGHDVRIAAMVGDRTNRDTSRTRALSRFTRWTPRPIYEVMELGYSAFGYRTLIQQVRSWAPDFIYERYVLHNFAGITASRRGNIPLVLEVNAPLALERAQYERLSWKGLAQRTERFIAAHASVVVVVSTSLRDYLVDHGILEQRVVVIPNAADPVLFAPNPALRDAMRAELRLGEGDVVVGFSGILRPWHGLDLLIEAVAAISSSERPHLLIVGDGPSREPLERLVRERGLSGRVTITGRVPHASIPKYIAAFDIGVSPRATFYASPMKIPEYMAAGIAVVGPRMANITDLIAEGRTGLLFQPESIADLSATLVDLIRDGNRRAQLAAAARDEIVQRRTWRHNAERVLERVRDIQ